jgi:hypothetical protein
VGRVEGQSAGFIDIETIDQSDQHLLTWVDPISIFFSVPPCPPCENFPSGGEGVEFSGGLVVLRWRG